MTIETSLQPADEPLDLPLERQIVWTKFSVPTLRSDRISRSRLVSRMEDFGENKLILVTAPAGWGKSTFLAQVAAIRKDCTAWLSLDEADNDAVQFLVYLCYALNQLHPGSASDALLLLNNPHPPSAKTIINLIISSFSSISERYLLILDDYHVLSTDEIHEAMGRLIERLPSSLSLAIASRSEPPLPVSRLRARGELLEIGADDLRFTKTEASELFSKSNHLAISDEAVQDLRKKTEGWAAGLQLAALSLRNVDDPERFVKAFSGANRYIVDYLVDEVLAGQTPEIQKFLLDTSILSRFSSGLCDAVTLRNNGQTTLETLDRSNLFLIALDDRREWYRYHHLFADALRSRLIGRHPEAISELHLRAAVWLNINGSKREAIDHALESGNFDIAVDYLNAWAREDWRDGNLETARKWLEALPRNVLLANPSLAIRLAQIYLFQSKLDLAQELVDIVEKTPEGATLPLLGEVQATLLHLTRFLGDNDRSLSLSHQALESLERSPEMGMRAYVHINLASLHLECGEIEDCMSSLDMAVKECRTVKDIHAELMISSTRVQALDLAGKLDEAGNALAALDRFLEQYSLGDSLESSLAACPKMEMLYERNLLDEAVKTASPYLKMPIAELSITVITPFAYTLSALGKGDEALELLLKWDTALQNTPAWWVPDKISHCRAFLLRHNRAASGEWLKSTEDKSCMLFWDTALTAIQKSRFYCDRGMFKKAMETAAPMLDKADELKCFDISLKLRAVLAAAQFALSEKRQAMETLAPALRLGESQGYVRAFIDTGDIIVPLLKHAVGCELSVEYCMKLLSFADFSSTQERQVLTEREIEVLRLVSEGHSNVQIAKMLYLSPGTVKRHIYNISIKLGASNRVEAVAIAKRIGALK